MENQINNEVSASPSPVTRKFFVKAFVGQYIITGVTLIFSFVWLLVVIGGVIYLTKQGSSTSSLENSVANSDCNVQVIPIHGILDTTASVYGDGSTTGTASTDVLVKISDALASDQVKAIMLDVDSFGGAPVAGAEIAEALSRSAKPTISFARTAAASAAYWAMLGSNKIYVNANSNVGSIGVTMSYLDYTKSNEKDGVTFQQLSIGKYKDTGNPGKSLSADEKDVLLRGAQKVYDNFVADVVHYRKLDESNVRALADGSVYIGQEALDAGLVDEIGSLDDVQSYIGRKIEGKAKLCWK